MKNISVSKSNNLVDASYKLNAQAQKLVLSCLAKLDSRDSIPKEITITASEFIELMGIEPKNAHRDLYRAADSLFDAVITIRDEGKTTKIRWVQEFVQKHEGEGSVTLVWSDKVVKYISQLQTRFTSYKLSNIALLQSSHSIRVYELLMKFKATGERTIYLEDFKSSLGIEDKYPQFKDLNKRVIKPSIDELNIRSDLTVSVVPFKKGRKIIGLNFSFKPKNQLKMDV